MENSYDVFIIKDQSSTKNNVYLIADKATKYTAIVDPACTMEQINKVVKQFRLNLKRVLITHTHSDHIRRVKDIVVDYGAEIYVSRKESEHYFYQGELFQTFEDENKIWIGNTEITCLLTPGHTYGSACFLLENSLFTGDTIFIEGCGLCQTKDSALDMFNSIQRIKEVVADTVLVYPGHTYGILPGASMAHLKENNIYFLLEDKEKFIEFRMRKNQTNLFRFI